METRGSPTHAGQQVEHRAQRGFAYRAILRTDRGPLTRFRYRVREWMLYHQFLPQLDVLMSSGLVSMGRFTYGCPDVRSYPGESTKAIIGSFVSIADHVRIFLGGNHRVEWVSTYPFRVMFDLPGASEDGHPVSKGDVVIGNDVWIGAGATILSGVHIGNGAVIGADAVVARDVMPYAIVVGNPAREVRRRFSIEQIEALESLAWWDWPYERILANVHLLSSPDIDGFLAPG